MCRTPQELVDETFMLYCSISEKKWREIHRSFMMCVLNLLCYKRDNEDLVLTPDEILNYLNLDTLVKEAWKYRKVHKSNLYLEEFVKEIISEIGIKYNRFCINNTISFKIECINNSKNRDIEGVYNMTLSSHFWMSIMVSKKIELQEKELLC